MSVQTLYRMVCDTCGLESDDLGDTAREAREYDEKQGWIRKRLPKRLGGKTIDVCPECLELER